MANPQLLYVLLSLASGIVLLGLAAQGWRRRSVVGAPAFVTLMLAVALWSIAYAFELLGNTTDRILLANLIKYFGIMFVPVAWFVFAMQYSGRKITFARWEIAALMMVPVIAWILRLAYPYTRIFFQDITINETFGFPALQPVYGIGFGLQLVYFYVLILIGAFWIIDVSLRSVRNYAVQTRLILLAVLVPIIGNLLTLLDVSPFPAVDLAPILFTFSGLIFERLITTPEGIGAIPISYDSIINNLPDAVLVVDANNVIQAVNPPLLRFLHQTEKGLVGHSIYEVIPEAETFLRKHDNVLEGREEVTMRGRHIEFIISPLYGVDKRVLGRIAVFRDDTVRKHIELVLMANERRYRALFDNSNDSIFILEMDLTIVIANLEASQMLGVDLANLLLTDFLQYIAPSEQQRLRICIDLLLKGDTAPIYESSFISKRDEAGTVPVEINLTLVRDSEGQPLNVQMIARDITERQRARQMLQDRLNQLAALRQVDVEVNRTLDMQQVLRLSLDAVIRHTGADAGFIALTRDDHIEIAAVGGSFSPDVIGQTLRYDIGVVGRVLENHAPEFIRDVHTDPNYFADLPETQSLMAIPLVSQDRLVGILNLEASDANRFNDTLFQFALLLSNRLSVAVDNARLYAYVREQLADLQTIYDELRRAENLKTDMIRIANHDLKNPLAITRGYIEILKQDVLPDLPHTADFFDEVGKALDRMHNILQDFLSVEAINSRVSDVKTLDLRALVDLAIQEHQIQMSNKSQSLQTELVDLEMAWIKGDYAQLYEAVANLISNAIKYTPDRGSIRVELTIHTDAIEPTVRFVVIDTGYGIPEDRQHRIFEPFFRSKTSETASIEGTGLGLHLVKNIIERHRGQIIFTSIYRQGSTFGFSLPLVAAETSTSDG